MIKQLKDQLSDIAPLVTALNERANNIVAMLGDAHDANYMDGALSDSDDVAGYLKQLAGDFEKTSKMFAEAHCKFALRRQQIRERLRDKCLK